MGGRAVAVLLVSTVVVLVSTVVVLVSTVVVLVSPPAVAVGGSVDFPPASCPHLVYMVRSSVKAALQQEIALAAGLLRIFFHDCFPQGCDASVYLKGPNSEQDMGPNKSLQQRALQLVENIRAKVHAACGPTVSCTDISALATRAAVVLSGGPRYPVIHGRLDSFAPAEEAAVNQLPSPFTGSVQALLDSFKSRGLGEPDDLVALSGAHTIGRSQCGFIRAPSDDTFSQSMAANCSRNPNRLQKLDVITPNAFDNAYYMTLVRNKGVFTSDMALIRDPTTAPIVRRFARNQAAFFAQFADSMDKLSRVPRPRGDVGEIRRNCFRRNGPRLAANANATDESFAASA